jgi:four helix bundle protein
MGFEELDVWKRAARLSASLYRELEKCREFGYKDQVTRSSVSVASNIAEGYERNTPLDRRKFLHYARGSCGELRTQLYIGIEAELLSRDAALQWIQETRELSATLNGLIRSWQNR